MYAVRNIRYYYSHVVNGVSAIIVIIIIIIIIIILIIYHRLSTCTEPVGVNIVETKQSEKLHLGLEKQPHILHPVLSVLTATNLSFITLF